MISFFIYHCILTCNVFLYNSVSISTHVNKKEFVEAFMTTTVLNSFSKTCLKSAQK